MSISPKKIFTGFDSTRYTAYNLGNFREIPQIARLSEEQLFEIEVVGRVLPFKTNNFVVDELIDWDNISDDPMFVLTFPQREMLLPHHYEEMARLVRAGESSAVIREAADRIRLELNPHPAGQLNLNVPYLDGKPLHGMQHKYRETVLFFPSPGQTCHAYCTFCFRWPQFVGLSGLKFASREAGQLVAYLTHPEVTDVLFTGGDPLLMSAQRLADYLEPLIAAELQSPAYPDRHKALSYWPYRFLTDADSDHSRCFGKWPRAATSGDHGAFQSSARTGTSEVSRRSAAALDRHDDSYSIAGTPSHQRRSGALGADVEYAVDPGCVPIMFLAGYRRSALFRRSLVRLGDFREAYQRVSGLGARYGVPACRPARKGSGSRCSKQKGKRSSR